MSQHAAILAHIAPRTGEFSGAQNAIRLMQQVIDHYNVGRRNLVFPPATSIVFVAIYQDSVALPEIVTVIRVVLERLGLNVNFREYPVREEGEARGSGDTSIVIQCSGGADPSVFVNNEPLDGSDVPQDQAGDETEQNGDESVDDDRNEGDNTDTSSANWVWDQTYRRHRYWDGEQWIWQT